MSNGPLAYQHRKYFNRTNKRFMDEPNMMYICRGILIENHLSFLNACVSDDEIYE